MKLSHLPASSGSRWLLPLMFGAAALLYTLGSHAQQHDPSSRVARISFASGSVSVQIGDASEWIQARINRPLTSGDQMFTDSGSRAELQMGMAALHLDENTQVRFLELSDNAIQLQLNQGVINLNVRGMDNDETVEIDTPIVSVTIPEPGDYRIEVNDDDETTVKVRNGSADVAGERERYTVQENEQLRLQGTDRLNAQFDDLGRMDDFDRWASNRNVRIRDATAARYVDDNVIGYEDLDSYGYWDWEADYGNVWYPNKVGRGWSPYRFGHWDWISPWGWTWVDDESWGFAPFHYGRWAEVHHRWCWVPGPRHERAVYAPALVAWIGAPGISVSAGVGSVGWIPLGPREFFRPHYTASAGYLARVNLSNSLLSQADIDRDHDHDDHHRDSFVNRGAAIAVPTRVFVGSEDVRRHLRPVNPRNWHRFDGFSDLKPNATAITGNARIVVRPSNLVERSVVARRRPMPILPRSGFSPERDSRAGGSIRLIAAPSSRRIDTRDDGHPERDFRPTTRDGFNGQETVDSPRHDRGDRTQGRPDLAELPSDSNDHSHRDWHNDPPNQVRPVPPPNTNQPRVTPRPVLPPNQQEPERHRIGPWINREQQLRPQPPRPEPQRPNPPPSNSAPRVEPPRHSPPPAPQRRESPPPNDHNDRRPAPLERRQVR